MGGKKRYNKKAKKARNTKKPTTGTKKKIRLWPKLALIYSVIITFVTIYSWLPKLSVEPQLMYFDGKHETFQIIITNNSFIPICNITTIIDLKELLIDNNNLSNNIQKLMDNQKVLHSNKPTTVHFRLFKLGMNPIKEIKKSNLTCNISYKLPLLPVSFNEDYRFTAIVNSDHSIKWLPK